jgi:hypothetical protein
MTTKFKATDKSREKQSKPTKAATPAVRTIRLATTEATHKVVTPEIVNHLVGRLCAVMRGSSADEATESQESFGLGAFAGFAPTTTAEVLLVSQMIATYEVGMNMLTRAKRANDIPNLQESGNLAVKLLGMYERQFQTLAKSRRPKQVVEVRHEHRHIHAHGQPLPGAGSVTQIEGQPHATSDPRALTLAPGPALLSQDPPRDPVPVASDAAGKVPNARRRP